MCQATMDIHSTTHCGTSQRPRQTWTTYLLNKPRSHFNTQTTNHPAAEPLVPTPTTDNIKTNNTSTRLPIHMSTTTHHTGVITTLRKQMAEMLTITLVVRWLLRLAAH